MTYQEIIDNIQTRIETIIANRFTDTYTITSISASDYNPDIDDSITVTITMEDQNGDPITNQSVPLYVDNNSISGLTTDNNGQATYTYNCEDWGLHTFTVNGKTIQTTVTGLKQIKQKVWSQSNLTYTLFVDESSRHCTLTIESNTGISIASGNTNYEEASFVPSQYRPKISKFVRISRTNNLLAYLWNSGTIGISNFHSSTLTNQQFGGQIDWEY